jgi:hypothetical protein
MVRDCAETVESVLPQKINNEGPMMFELYCE